MLAPPLDSHALEKLRAEELAEARSIQAEMLPAESLRAGPVTISHKFKPIAAVGGDFLDYFQLMEPSASTYVMYPAKGYRPRSTRPCRWGRCGASIRPA
jgi:hypothetical protein